MVYTLYMLGLISSPSMCLTKSCIKFLNFETFIDISGWEYTTDGKCEKMPSTRLLNVKIRSLPCLEQEGMIWIWPGDDPPTATLPSLQPPSGFEIHAEVCYRCF